MRDRPVPDAIRFWQLVQDSGNEKNPTCWNWKGTLSSNGYGSFKVGSQDNIPRHNERANRVAWKLAKGPIPDGLSVLHKCDNKLCVNPEHLFLGTNKDNTHDMIAKGRRVPAYTYQSYRPNSGVFKPGHAAYNKGRPRIG